MNWTLQVLGFVPNLFIMGSTYALRHKHVSGWVLGIIGTIAWAVFDVYVSAWAAIFWCVVIGGMEVHGWVQWRSNERETTEHGKVEVEV